MTKIHSYCCDSFWQVEFAIAVRQKMLRHSLKSEEVHKVSATIFIGIKKMPVYKYTGILKAKGPKFSRSALRVCGSCVKNSFSLSTTLS